MRRNEHHSISTSPVYSWGGDEFRVANTFPKIILCLPGKGSFEQASAIVPQWKLLHNAASNLILSLHRNGFTDLPKLHTNHIVELATEKPGDDNWWLCCHLPEGPGLQDWQNAILADEVALTLKAVSGLHLHETGPRLVAETRCDAPHPFYAPDIDRLHEFCTLNIFKIDGPYSWITDLDANTGSLGLSILRVPVRKYPGACTVC